jgi:hypothetical protein
MGKTRLLVSARDPATSIALKIFINSILIDKDFCLHVVAQEPAYSSFLGMSNLSQERLYFFPTHNDKKSLLRSAEEIIDKVSPDIILTGISGPDYGIDEAILTVAPQSKYSPYALQSFWGDVNKALPGRAQTYLVLNDYAAEITSRITGKRTVVVGSLKHEGYESLNPIELRRSFRSEIAGSNSKLLIGFFGQPLGGVQAYKETVSIFADLVKSMHPNSIIIYRPHPKETGSLTRWTINQLLGTRNKLIISDSTVELEAVLSGVDVVASAFSTCGYDLQQLIRISSKPLGIPLYLMMNANLVDWYRKYTNLDFIPMTNNGMAVVADSVVKLKKNLQFSSINRQRRICWESVNKGFPKVKNSSFRIRELFINDLASS